MIEPSGISSAAPHEAAVLEELRALRPIGWPAELSLAPLRANQRRRDHGDRSAFLVTHDGAPIAHLTVGDQLETLAQQTEKIFKVLPLLTARPLLHAEGKSHRFFAREFIAGGTLSDQVRQGTLSPANAHEQGLAALALLQQTATASTVASAQAEASGILGQVARLPECSRIDRAFFDELVAPFIHGGIAASVPQLRWTNGDFTPRNLILDTRGQIRLIDYEFAAQTHFPDDEWRWNTFGELGPIPRFNSSPPAWLEILFWCRQLVLSHSTIARAEAAADADHAFDQITTLLQKEGRAWQESAFLRRLAPALPFQAEIARLSSAEATLSDKLSRTLASRSWRYTAWLRAIRRLLNRSS
jgi:hypothetical protein